MPSCMCTSMLYKLYLPRLPVSMPVLAKQLTDLTLTWCPGLPSNLPHAPTCLCMTLVLTENRHCSSAGSLWGCVPPEWGYCLAGFNATHSCLPKLCFIARPAVTWHPVAQKFKKIQVMGQMAHKWQDPLWPFPKLWHLSNYTETLFLAL